MAPSRSKVEPEKPYRPGIVAIIIDRTTGEVLVGKIHADRRKDIRHHWSLIEGGIDAGETPEAAARREAHEEVGLTAPILIARSTREIRYRFDDRHPRYAGKSLTLVVLIVDSRNHQPDLDPGIDHEGPSFAEVRWLTADDAARFLSTNSAEGRRAFCEELTAHIKDATQALQRAQKAVGSQDVAAIIVATQNNLVATGHYSATKTAQRPDSSPRAPSSLQTSHPR